MLSSPRPNTRDHIRSVLRAHPGLSLHDFILRTHTTLESLYDDPGIVADQLDPEDLPDCYTSWQRRHHGSPATTLSPEQEELEAFLFRRLRRFLHVGDPMRCDGYISLLRKPTPVEDLSQQGTVLAGMLVASAFGTDDDEYDGLPMPGDLDEALNQLRSIPAFIDELEQIFTYTAQRHQAGNTPLDDSFACGLLYHHAQYNIYELIAALAHTPFHPLLEEHPQEGMLHLVEKQHTLLVSQLADEPGQLASTVHPLTAVSPKMISWHTDEIPHYPATSSDAASVDDHSLVCAVRSNPARELGITQYVLLGEAHWTDADEEHPGVATATLAHPMPSVLCRQWLSCGC